MKMSNIFLNVAPTTAGTRPRARYAGHDRIHAAAEPFRRQYLRIRETAVKSASLCLLAITVHACPTPSTAQGLINIAPAPRPAESLLPGSPCKGPLSESQPKIDSIVVKGNKFLNSAGIITVSGHKVGDPCTVEALTQMRDNLAKSGNFGMHHPDAVDQWVKLQAVDVGNDRCLVTITVDENDRLTGITISGSGPIKAGEISAQITRGVVFNFGSIANDSARILDLYNTRGYTARFSKSPYMDPKSPGVLVVPLEVTRVGKIDIVTEGGKSPELGSLRGWTTRPGDYLNRKTVYEADRKKLMDSRLYDNVTIAEQTGASGTIDLRINLVPKKRSNHD